jgi:hypothetical protein
MGFSQKNLTYGFVSKVRNVHNFRTLVWPIRLSSIYLHFGKLTVAYVVTKLSCSLN